MDGDLIEWKSVRDDFGRKTTIISEFASDHSSTLFGYSTEDVELILPLVKGDVVFLKEENEAIPELYRHNLRKILDPSSEEEEEEEEEEEDEEEEEGEMYQTNDNRLVDMTTKSALMTMTNIDELMLGDSDENLLNWFSNGIYHWYQDDSFSSGARCCHHKQLVIFLQFIMTWFGGVIAGGFPACILKIKRTYCDYDLFLPISIGCRLYGQIIHALNKRHFDKAIRVVRKHFKTCIKNWIMRYSKVSCHTTVKVLQNDHKLFKIFGMGLRKFMPRRIGSFLFAQTLLLLQACTVDLRKRFDRVEYNSYSSVHGGCIRLKNHHLNHLLDVIIQFVPYSNRHIADAQSWNAFNVLSNFYMHYTRSLISDFETMHRTVSGRMRTYRVTIKRMHSLYHPSWKNYAMLRLLYGYLNQVQSDLRDCERFPKPFTYISQQKSCLVKLREKLSKYLEGKDMSSGMQTDRVAKLGSICLCTLLSHRDLSPMYFLSHFQCTSKYVNAAVYKLIAKALHELEEIPDMTTREHRLKSFEIRLLLQ